MRADPRATVLFAIALLALSACGQEGPDEEADLATPPAEDQAADTDDAVADGVDAEEADAAQAEDDASGDEAGAATVDVASVELGDVLVDGEGFTLYVFDPDEQGESTCYQECASSWPPLVTDGEPQAGDGVEADLLSTTSREDGAEQVTYDGWPLYRWAGDDAPGDMTGHGVQDVWWVVAPSGEPVRDGSDGQEEPSSGY
jgi:predicted lipoprotein with Yx(FWY)xxD motif